MAAYRDLSKFFYAADWTRSSDLAAWARLGGATFSLYAVVVDTLHLPQFVERLSAKLDR